MRYGRQHLEGNSCRRICNVRQARLLLRLRRDQTKVLHPNDALLQFGEALKENKWPAELKAGLIGSCTNSSYEDMQRAASVAQQALKAGIKAKASLSHLLLPQRTSLLSLCEKTERLLLLPIIDQ